ncbi:MAG: hypothetical protein HND52_05375 [Ignavibacteriae bacterium]|nr:hypothetical protein [Ignavibacteriota bacterium]NOG97383.1 hypothetical protein [Ignavibacteriota bacterium]
MYDILGNEIPTLVDELIFDATELSSGVYFYRMTSGININKNKMISVE